ncbi:Chemotaxis protein CheX [Acidisarcina polymorpha]|uniref:Chemotaxis protein CheX n=1 Tax=Acidisarcina polymorpha TaxID=2211140 RepID=A0A2Z5FSR2_9BACT|nr:chemotaxis protein CheX [Acidisarcina polymorpha]AXC09507.1 Chemotaxis protein CheX [Acidisarcina polymorpha]
MLNQNTRDKQSAQNEFLDLSVAEVFQLMMDVSCVPVLASAISPPSDTETTEGVTAIIGLAGKLSGACVLRMPETVALKLAELMVGTPMTHFDRTVKDALGEVCNMLAGTWKGKQAEFAATCMLSVPAVISGSDYEFHLPRPAFHTQRTYCFVGQLFTFSIDCQGL